MSNTTFKKIELVGTSTESFSDATSNAITKASESIRGMSWFEVIEQRGSIADGKVAQFQVTVKVGFRIE